MTRAKRSFIGPPLASPRICVPLFAALAAGDGEGNPGASVLTSRYVRVLVLVEMALGKI